jgi:nicotinate phosphoribosyltransferase
MPESRGQLQPHGSGGAALFTDLYELTMAQAYDAEGMDRQAVFELYFRRMPERRGYIVAAGLADVLAYLEDWRFSADDLDYLRGQGSFRESFLERLRDMRFTGDVYAVPEGTPVFPYEPLVQVVAPVIEAQLIETYLLNQVHLQSVVASKAARVLEAAAGRTVVDFGSRRAHGTDAALKVARACYLVGGAGTSNVLAGKLYGVPIFGTMAHSYVQAHDDELRAFEAFAGLFPGTTLLVDTYDTLNGVRKVIGLARKLGDRFDVRAVRLDSGDLAELAKQARKLLDEAGLKGVHLFASSGLDEYKIAKLIEAGAPIDGFGVGTGLAISTDAPDLDMAYKLVEYGGESRTKLSSAKVIYPGRKQVFRVVEQGRAVRDVVARHDEQCEGEPLLQPVMRGGKRLPAGAVSLEDARQHALRELGRLPGSVKGLGRVETPYPVEVSERVQEDLASLRHRLAAREV